MIVSMITTNDVWAPLPGLGLIQVSGADAVAFLQTQLTNEIVKQNPGEAAWNAYCQPKGRMLASFLVWKHDDSVYLSVARDIAPTVTQRLRMYILRAKAQVLDVSDEWQAWGYWQSANNQALMSVHTESGAFSIRVPDVHYAQRTLICAPKTQAASVEQALYERAMLTDPTLWSLSQIHAGIADIQSATVEKFVPQMVNYELIGGVSFKKGCYPGQEVVARSQYLGKLKRRMRLGRLTTTEATICAGMDVTTSDVAEPVGMVVNAAVNRQGGIDLLFETTFEAMQSRLFVAGQALEILPLPYTVPTEATVV